MVEGPTVSDAPGRIAIKGLAEPNRLQARSPRSAGVACGDVEAHAQSLGCGSREVTPGTASRDRSSPRNLGGRARRWRDAQYLSASSTPMRRRQVGDDKVDDGHRRPYVGGECFLRGKGLLAVRQ